MAMVQDPASAKYDGMPRSAINTGLVDYVASAEELPAKLIQYVNHVPRPAEDRVSAEEEPSAALEKVFVLLRAHTGNDFSCYKNSTIGRRIERRMSVHQFDSLPRYVRFLQENPQEVELLYKELLIGVTNFFRDPGLFDFLKEKAIPQLLQDRPKDGPLRVWNPGCSTGEETYSLAIVLKECLEGLKLQDSSDDPDFCHRHRQGRHRQGPPGDVFRGHRRGRVPGAAGSGSSSAKARATGSRKRSATWWSLRRRTSSSIRRLRSWTSSAAATS